MYQENKKRDVKEKLISRYDEKKKQYQENIRREKKGVDINK